MTAARSKTLAAIALPCFAFVAGTLTSCTTTKSAPTGRDIFVGVWHPSSWTGTITCGSMVTTYAIPGDMDVIESGSENVEVRSIDCLADLLPTPSGSTAQIIGQGLCEQTFEDGGLISDFPAGATGFTSQMTEFTMTLSADRASATIYASGTAAPDTDAQGSPCTVVEQGSFVKTGDQP
jgi:hypothetical protein